jgi:hypothetical protein
MHMFCSTYIMITFIFREWDKFGDIFEKWRMGNAQIKLNKQIKKEEEKKPPIDLFFKWKNQLKKQKLW